MPKQIFILRGCPGSGKSTYAKNVLKATDVDIFSADKYFMRSGEYKFDPTELGDAHGSCKDGFALAVADGKPLIVVDNTNMVWREMENYVYIGLSTGYVVTLVDVGYGIDPKVAAARNVHRVPADKVVQMAGRKLFIPEFVLANPNFRHIQLV